MNLAGGTPRVAMSEFRQIPSVDQILNTNKAGEMIATFGRSLTLKAVRLTLDEIRSEIPILPDIPSITNLLATTQKHLETWVSSSLKPVINATGVILHTNLGRAPLSLETFQYIKQVSSGYCNLEYDLDTGRRGDRLIHAETLLKMLLSVEAALVVNNNAAAILLVLGALANRQNVITARSQLVEIGGSFRIPDIMKQSGAKLVEVGTTNRVHLSDYEEALKQPAGMIFRAHHSNFKIIGFTIEPTLADLASLGKNKGVLVVDDLGSGTILETNRFGLSHEPMVQESLSAGADLVCFSGDKLLGGPQAGIIVGREDLVKKLKKHPLSRVLRADKLCLAGLAFTLLHYLKDEAEIKIPVWQMISMPLDEIQKRATRWKDSLGMGEVIQGRSTVGGGSLPEETLPTFIFAIRLHQNNRFIRRLREQTPPIIARLEEDQVFFDPRTVLSFQDEDLLSGIKNVINNS